MSDQDNALVGAWRLVAMEYRYPDGRVRYPQEMPGGALPQQVIHHEDYPRHYR